MARHRWLESCVILCAALAIMATSRPRAHKSAVLPASDETKARVILVEASQQPDIMVSPPAGTIERGYHAVPLDPEAWPGRNRYLVPME